MCRRRTFLCKSKITTTPGLATEARASRETREAWRGFAGGTPTAATLFPGRTDSRRWYCTEGSLHFRSSGVDPIKESMRYFGVGIGGREFARSAYAANGSGGPSAQSSRSKSLGHLRRWPTGFAEEASEAVIGANPQPACAFARDPWNRKTYAGYRATLYQIVTRLSGARYILSPGLTPNAP